MSLVVVFGVIYSCGYRIKYDKKARPFKFVIRNNKDRDISDFKYLPFIYKGPHTVIIDKDEENHLFRLLDEDSKRRNK